MIRSNSKEARRAVESYVLSEIETVNERAEYDGTYNAHRPVTSAFDVLKDEMRYQSDYDGKRAIMGAGLASKYRKAGRYGFVAADNPYWVWWLACKAGCFTISYHDQRTLIKSWLQETEEEASAYSNNDVLFEYCHLTSYAFDRLYERENTPHKVKTSDFVELYKKHNGGHFFDRETLRFFSETMRSFSVYGFELVAASDGCTHDCYVVNHTITTPDGYKLPKTAYFDRDTIEQIFPN